MGSHPPYTARTNTTYVYRVTGDGCSNSERLDPSLTTPKSPAMPSTIQKPHTAATLLERCCTYYDLVVAIARIFDEAMVSYVVCGTMLLSFHKVPTENHDKGNSFINMFLAQCSALS